jgi:hypothetical protein
MINSLSLATHQNTDRSTPGEAGNLTLQQYTDWLDEIMNQPQWRSKADREMDYVDGNQLDSDVLQRMKSIGMAPAIEPLIGPAVDAVLGFEAKTRTDWRISADGEGQEGQDTAAALNFKLNQAERHSGADRAMSDAFKPQLCVGIGWVEVARESDPFKFPYRCKAIHRNEIYWDFLAKEPDLSDARFLIRRKWTETDLAALLFPDKADFIKTVGNDGRWTERMEVAMDGSASTGMANSAIDERGWSIEEQEWRDSMNKRVCLFEVWYRRWVSIIVLKSPDGRVVEYDKANPMHVAAVARGLIQPMRTVVSRVFRSFWLGPHKLTDEPSPYPHCHFPYVPFWGKREDRTGVPYGVVRGMVFLQDNINSAISKIRWGLSSVRTIRTKGAVIATDAQFRSMIARVDADIILDDAHMSKPGALFKVERDFQLNEQQYKMLGDSRMGIVRASGITPSFQGQEGTATSGVQENAQIEQTTQALADLMDNFRYGRTMVGEQLVSMLIEDLGTRQEEVVISARPPRKERRVVLNQPAVDEATGIPYRNNDVQRIRLKVALEDVPTTSSFRAQQLAAMSEAYKAMPPNIQLIVLPHLLALMDVPNRDEMVAAIQQAAEAGQITEEQVKQRIQQALKNAQYDLKNRELAYKYDPERIARELSMLDANIANLDAKTKQTVALTVKGYIDAMFAAVQGAEVITAVPEVTPAADVLISNAGGLPKHDAIPVAGPGAALSIEEVKNKRTGVGFVPGAGGGAAAGDTSPNTPASPAQPASPFVGAGKGIETMRPDSVGA